MAYQPNEGYTGHLHYPIIYLNFLKYLIFQGKEISKESTDTEFFFL
jgi:hypothetical protein